MKKIDEMAREAGDDWDSTQTTDKEFLKRYAELVRAEEREACARMVEDKFDFVGDELIIADAIRARGNT